jgi:hypothetical protein
MNPAWQTSLIVVIFATSYYSAASVSQSSPRTDERTVYPVSILSESNVYFPTTPAREGFAIDVSRDSRRADRDFPEDNFVLQVQRTARFTKPLAEYRFHSSYGHFDLSLVDVKGEGVEDFFLVTGQSRGTNVRIETLTVLQRDGQKFLPMLKVPVSGPCGVSCRWEYERHFTDVNGDGIVDLHLVRKITGNVAKEDHADIPREPTKDYIFDPQTRKMVRYP